MEELIQRQNEWHTCPEAERCARGIPPITECMNLHGVSVSVGGARGYISLQLIDNIKSSVQRLWFVN